MNVSRRKIMSARSAMSSATINSVNAENSLD
jgi:hypothetical protein